MRRLSSAEQQGSVAYGQFSGEESKLVQPQDLRRFVDELCRALGADAEIAAEVARHLVAANLAGHDSHGVLRMAQYARGADQGDLVPSARPEISRERGATTLFDAHHGFGHFSTRVACEWAAERAREQGVAAAAIRHSSHIGRLGDYAERLAGQGLVGVVTVGMAGSNWRLTVLPGTGQRFLGANPWAFGIPDARGEPVVVDISTSMVAEGKLRVARAKNEPVPEGWIVDAEGRPSRDPNDFYAGGGLLPLGGVVAGHKGYGLGLASVLCGALAQIGDTEPGAAPRDADQLSLNGVFLTAIDPEAFGGRAAYAGLVAEVADAVKTVPGVDGEVRMPGDIERANRIRREQAIPLPGPTWQDLVELGSRFGVAAP
ncbi:MAG: Ldh family oxidoreductase [Nocardioidaceae bacterium]